MTDADLGTSPGSSPRRYAIPVLGLVMLAWVLYRPDVPRPFDFVDFPDNILILKQHPGFVERFQALSTFYGKHGRFSPITLAAIAGQWSAFESWTVGWQLFRFATFAAVVVMAYRLYVRLRLAPLSAFAVACFLVVSPAAVIGWTRLSTAEPLGMVWLLIACHFALSPRTTASSVAFALSALGVLWTKEVMIAAFSFPLLLAMQFQRASGGFQATLRWMAPALFATALGAIPVIVNIATAGPDAFSARYGSSAFALGDVAGATFAAWLPFAPLGSAVALLVVVFVFLSVLVLGWHESLASVQHRSANLWLFASAVAVPFTGALIYAPWPFYLLVYALPFAVAGALLFGHAASALSRAHVAGRLWSAVGIAIVLTFSLAQASTETGRTYALQQVFMSAVGRVAAMPGIDSALVGVAAAQLDSRVSLAVRFVQYAGMQGLNWPAVRDVTCDQLPALPHERTVVLRLNLMCEPVASTEAPIISHYRRFTWPSPIPTKDSVMLTLATSGISPP